MNEEACQNCKKHIPEDKLLTHQAYCFRNFISCLQCGEFYDKSQGNLHIENHQLIHCDDCNISYQTRHEEQHQRACKGNKIVCQFCQIPIKSRQFINHITTCGNRTQECSRCNRFVTLRDKQKHTCEQEVEIIPIPNSRRNLKRSIDEDQDVQILDTRRGKKLTTINLRNRHKNEYIPIQSEEEVVESRPKRLQKKSEKISQQQESKFTNQRKNKINYRQQQMTEQQFLANSMLQQAIQLSKKQF